MKSLVAAFLAVSLALPLSGCARKPSLNFDTKYPTFTPSSTDISATLQPLDAETQELYNTYVNAFRDDLFLINNYSLKLGYDDASGVIAAVDRYRLKLNIFPELLHNCEEAALARAQELYPGMKVSLSTDYHLPSWYFLAAALPFVEDAEDVFSLLSLEINIEKDKSAATVFISTYAPTIKEFADMEAALLMQDETKSAEAAHTYLDIRFTYAYLTAVFDADGKERTDINTYFYPFSSEYIEKLVWPLDDFPEFYDTWAQGRSHNTRAHMGTDIKTDEGNAIYSCTDGTVLYIGTADIPGNYVIVMDDDGFEYHYYHMCRLSTWVKPGDRVTAGQRIGDVGDTGNSDRPHLHVSLISPDGVFLNPFRLMSNLEKTAKKAAKGKA